MQWFTSVITALWKAEVGGSPEVGSSRPSWPTWTNSISIKNKISWAWWCMPIIPATWEAEAENCLNLGGEGSSELRFHHCTPASATRMKLSLKKKWIHCHYEKIKINKWIVNSNYCNAGICILTMLIFSSYVFSLSRDFLNTWNWAIWTMFSPSYLMRNICPYYWDHVWAFLSTSYVSAHIQMCHHRCDHSPIVEPFIFTF